MKVGLVKSKGKGEGTGKGKGKGKGNGKGKDRFLCLFFSLWKNFDFGFDYRNIALKIQP